MHVSTVAFLMEARKRFCWALSSPQASVIVCDVTHVSIDAMCVCVCLVDVYMTLNTCYVHVHTDVLATHRQSLNPRQRGVLLVALWFPDNP